MPPGTYAGIGSRHTPPEVLALMGAIAAARAREGWVLRTGMSPGADQAFHGGARRAGGRVELYLPWPGFQREAWSGKDAEESAVLDRPAAAAYDLAARFHPRWASLDVTQRALLARDCHEVLGADLDTPAEQVICWTADRSLDGVGLLDDGTGQALRIAHGRGIPIYNLARPDHARRLS
jgi:hypothetical protein